jgi:hypothetical protein
MEAERENSVRVPDGNSAEREVVLRGEDAAEVPPTARVIHAVFRFALSP